MKYRFHQPSLIAALLFTFIGALVLFESNELSVGDLSEMGPGYMPRALACLLMLIGAAVAFRGLTSRHESLGVIKARPLAAIFAAMGIFACILAIGGGFILASIALVSISSLATPSWKFKEIALSCICVIPFIALVFIVALGLQIKVWPW